MKPRIIPHHLGIRDSWARRWEGTFLISPRGLGKEEECVNNGEDKFPIFLDLDVGSPG
jgi:hypothetical protein